MAGLLTPTQGGTAAPQDAGAAPEGQLQDPILQQIEQGVEQAVPPDMKQGYNNIVNAGMAVMFSKGTSAMMDDQLQASPDIVANVSDGISKLMVMLYNESKGQMQIEAVGLAAVTLMAQALDYWEKSGGGQVTEEIVNEATKQTMTKTLEKFGITGDQLKQVIAAGQQAGAGGGMGAEQAGGMPAQGGAQPQAMGV